MVSKSVNQNLMDHHHCCCRRHRRRRQEYQIFCSVRERRCVRFECRLDHFVAILYATTQQKYVAIYILIFYNLDLIIYAPMAK